MHLKMNLENCSKCMCKQQQIRIRDLETVLSRTLEVYVKTTVFR